MHFQLEPLSIHCQQCPANHQSERYGCWSWIEFPLSREAEIWIYHQLPRRLNAGRRAGSEQRRHANAGRALLEAMQARGITGEPVDQARSSGLLESRRPFIRRYGPPWRRRQLSTSMILELIFYSGILENEASELLLRGLGVWEDRPGRDLPEVAFTAPLDSSDEASLAEFKRLLLALMYACSLNITVSTSLEMDDGATEATA